MPLSLYLSIGELITLLMLLATPRNRFYPIRMGMRTRPYLTSLALCIFVVFNTIFWPIMVGLTVLGVAYRKRAS